MQCTLDVASVDRNTQAKTRGELSCINELDSELDDPSSMAPRPLQTLSLASRLKASSAFAESIEI